MIAQPEAQTVLGPSLERLLMPMAPAALDSAAGRDPPVWLTAGSWRLLARVRPAQARGEEIKRFLLPSGDAVSAVLDSEGSVRVPFDLDEVYANYVTEAWRCSVRTWRFTPGQLEIYYRVKRFLPPAWLLQARRAFIKWTGLPAFPAWPFDESVVHLLRFYALCLLLAADAPEASFRWFWPHRYRAALILTHDVESEAGLRLAIELADLEQSQGFRSSFNIIGSGYPIDHGVLRELRDRGFEIGLHGLRHDRSLFSSRAAFEEQLPALARAAESLGAEGFRSPSTYRVLEWLGELPSSYDCSVPHSDPFEPQPGGCCTLWPFFVGPVVELPYTLPQDHTLFTLLRTRSIQPWLTQVEAVEQRFGLVQCISHPDPGYLGDPDNRALYAEFLTALTAHGDLWKALPRDVAAWWRRRDAGDPTDPDVSLGRIRRDESARSADFEPPER